MIEDPTNLTSSSHISQYYGNYNKNDTTSLQLSIEVLLGR